MRLPKTGAPNNQDWKQKVPVPLVAFTIVMLVLYVFAVAWFSFQEPPRHKGAAEIRFDAHIAELEKSCKGDFSKLSPAERKKLDDETMGHGAILIKESYEHPP